MRSDLLTRLDLVATRDLVDKGGPGVTDGVRRVEARAQSWRVGGGERDEGIEFRL
jgi:hypothetical protein